jgi:hypothetical protein
MIVLITTIMRIGTKNTPKNTPMWPMKQKLSWDIRWFFPLANVSRANNMNGAGIDHAITEIMTMCFLVRCPNTMISFWNMTTASAPIQATEAIVKYWISREQKVQPASL